jgi:hypothetical protein
VPAGVIESLELEASGIAEEQRLLGKRELQERDGIRDSGALPLVSALASAPCPVTTESPNGFCGAIGGWVAPSAEESAGPASGALDGSAAGLSVLLRIAIVAPMAKTATVPAPTISDL